MKETLLQYAGYNIWANKRIIEVMMKLDAAQLNQNQSGSFPSVQKTVLHIWSAEFTWLQRLQLAEHPVWAEDSFQGDFSEACKHWQDVSFQLKEFVAKQFNDAAFDHVLQYYTRKKQPFKNKVGDVLLHVFNHSTYHRGQLVTMLRGVGVKEIPGTDYIIFCRQNNR